MKGMIIGTKLNNISASLVDFKNPVIWDLRQVEPFSNCR